MAIIYSYGSPTGYSFSGRKLSRSEYELLKHNAIKLLTARGNSDSIRILQKYNFEVHEAYNDFNDEFEVLYAKLEVLQYEELRSFAIGQLGKDSLKLLAKAFEDLNHFIRLIAVDIDKERPPSGNRLIAKEIDYLVREYIGIKDGYLGDFSYRTHREFYRGLGIDINPDEYEGTTRQRFINILNDSDELTQGKILSGILEKYPPNNLEGRTPDKAKKIHAWVSRLQGISPVETPLQLETTENVFHALRDAEELLKSRGAISAVDRMHTALHGYLYQKVIKAKISCQSTASITEIFKLLREGHPRLTAAQYSKETEKIIRSMSAIIDALNTIRNHASLAHPNNSLLQQPEAMLAINIARTIIHYVESQVK